MDRRRFLQAAGGVAAGLSVGTLTRAAENDISAAKLPRWRGFNLLEKFIAPRTGRSGRFREEDFQWIADWGFDFVRLPLSYRCWTPGKDWKEISEPVLNEIDEAGEFGKQHGIHVCLNFHRAPGYCVNPPAEPFALWAATDAL